MPSKADIKNLKNYLTYKKDYEYIAKAISCDRCEVNISNEIGFKDDTEDLSLDTLFEELDELMQELCNNYKNNGLLGMR